MRPFTRHHQSTGETPEETLARLDAASDEAGPDPASCAEPGSIRGRPRGSRFPLVATRFEVGYDTNDVDAFINTLEQRTLDEVRRVRFSTISLVRGYDPGAVDQFLDVQAARLAGEVDPHPTPSQPGAAPRHKEQTLEEQQDDWWAERLAGHPRRLLAVLVLNFIIICLFTYLDLR